MEKVTKLFDFISVTLLTFTGLYLVYVFSLSLPLTVRVLSSLTLIFIFFVRLIVTVETRKVSCLQEKRQG